MTGALESGARTVTAASEGDLAAWQAFADGRDDAGPMHHAGWYGVLRDGFTAPPLFLQARDANGRIHGILPMYKGHGLITGTHYSSLEGGILADGPEAYRALLDAAIALRDEPRVRYVQIRGGVDDAPLPAAKVHSLVETSQGSDAAWKAIRQKDRSEVLNAERQGVNASLVEDFAGLDDFYKLYAKRMRELGTPVFRRAVLRSIVENLGVQRLRLYVVRQRASGLGYALFVTHGRRWTNLYAVTDTSAAPLGTNKLLYWSAIRDATQAGIDDIDLGRSVPGGGVHAFKRHLGGKDVEVIYGFYPAAGCKLGAVVSAQAHSTIYQRVWKRLPLGLCNLAGPAIRSGLPFL